MNNGDYRMKINYEADLGRMIEKILAERIYNFKVRQIYHRLQERCSYEITIKNPTEVTFKALARIAEAEENV